MKFIDEIVEINSGDLVEAEFQCQTCEVKFDHMGNVISGKENCFTNNRDHLLDCPSGLG